MTDRSFEELLNATANLSRPQIAVESDLQVANPTYELLEAEVAMRLRPTSADLDRSLLGRFPQATALAYMAPTELAANDRLAQATAVTMLTEAAPAESTTLVVASAYGFAAGSRIHLRGESDWEAALVDHVDGNSLHLAAALNAGFAAGDTVEAVTSYTVLGVLDEAGACHHIKVALQRREL